MRELVIDRSIGVGLESLRSPINPLNLSSMAFLFGSFSNARPGVPFDAIFSSLWISSLRILQARWLQSDFGMGMAYPAKAAIRGFAESGIPWSTALSAAKVNLSDVNTQRIAISP